MKEIVKVLLQEGISEEVIHEVLDVISERNKENKTKKEKWEAKNAKVSMKKKKEIQGEIKNLADDAKEDKKIAYEKDHIYSQQPSGPVADFYNDQYQDYLRQSTRKNVEKDEIAKELHDKLKRKNPVAPKVYPA